MKKSIPFILIMCIFFSNLSVVFASENINTSMDDSILENFMQNDTAISILKSNNIEVIKTSENRIKLKNSNIKTIEKANQLLIRSATTYPTEWVHMPAYDTGSSDKFRKATKTAFSAAVASWLQDMTSTATKLGIVAASAFLTYYFVDSETEDVYYFKKYYYRAVGPGFFDHNGNFIGDYEIKKFERITKESDGTGGQTKETIKESTIIDPFF